jgi:hypothetical protein
MPSGAPLASGGPFSLDIPALLRANGDPRQNAALLNVAVAGGQLFYIQLFRFTMR